jgi:hypothetical protein
VIRAVGVESMEQTCKGCRAALSITISGEMVAVAATVRTPAGATAV